MTSPTGPPVSGSRTEVLVVGYDDQPAAPQVLRTAADLAQRLRASLLVVHALPVLPVLPVPITAGAGLGAVTAFPVAPEDDRADEAMSEAARRRAAEHLDPTGVPWSWVCVAAEPAHLLEEQADAADAYLLVVGAPERGWSAAVEHLLTGSTSRELRRLARRPLLVVPSAEQAAEADRSPHT